MKKGFARLISRSLETWSRIGGEAFPAEFRCGICRHPLASPQGLPRQCPRCLFPLSAADPWAAALA